MMSDDVELVQALSDLEIEANETAIPFDEYLYRAQVLVGHYLLAHFVDHILHEVFDPILEHRGQKGASGVPGIL